MVLGALDEIAVDVLLSSTGATMRVVSMLGRGRDVAMPGPRRYVIGWGPRSAMIFAAQRCARRLSQDLKCEVLFAQVPGIDHVLEEVEAAACPIWWFCVDVSHRSAVAFDPTAM